MGWVNDLGWTTIRWGAFGLSILCFHPPAYGIPLYAARSAHACATCHTEPLGWVDPPRKSERRCTLDCNACHTNQTGGGMRTPIGRYYARQQLPMFVFKQRPAHHAEPERHRPEWDRYSSAGRYRLWEGFSGWQAGETPHHTIDDRLGNIDANPNVMLGFDGRVLSVNDLQGNVTTFPMQFDVHGWARMSEGLSAYTTVGLMGSQRRTFQNPSDDTPFIERVAISELVVQARLPHSNSYLRMGRFYKPYGLRHPDHTAFNRRLLGLNQDTRVIGIEGGYNPNYFFANAALYAEDVVPWLNERTPQKGIGGSAMAGYRDLGWQAGASLEVLALDAGPARVTAGPMWMLTLYPVVLMGEVAVQAQAARPARWVMFHVADWTMVRGLRLRAEHHYLVEGEDRQAQVSGGLFWDVVAGFQWMLQARQHYDSGSVANQDLLTGAHFWF